MPFFKSTYNILKTPWEDEVFNPNWMDSNKLSFPPKNDWDYAREMQIEDVDIWEVIFQGGGGYGLYAAWSPFAEFYMITNGWIGNTNTPNIETYYGPGAQKLIQKRVKELNFPIRLNKIWVEPDEMWLYQ
jgi:hypothetical protein